MTTVDPAMAEFCRAALGPCVVATHPQADHNRHLASVRDERGRGYVAKRHTNQDKHEREVQAYNRWVPVLGELTPQLVATDPDLPAILLTAIPGASASNLGTPGQASVHRQAGRLLRRLHEAEPAKPLPDFAQGLADRVDWWLGRNPGLLTTDEERLVRRHVAALGELPPPIGVPCHLDYQPRNWLVDATGMLRLIDFEHSRIDAVPRDLVRLEFRYWRKRPDLRDAFLEGYGRPLSETEQRTQRYCAAVDVVTCLARGRETGDHLLAAHAQTTLRELQHPADP